MKKIFFIFLLTFTYIAASAQNETWPKVFWKYKNTDNIDLIETYDKGYILLNSIRPDSLGIMQTWMWIVKTDVNGEILWEKTIGDGVHVGGFNHIYQTDDGGYILAGGTYKLNNLSDPLFMKLNACGEKEWCRIFHQTGQYLAYCAGRSIYPVPGEDGFIALVSSWGNEFVPGGGIFKGIWLFRLDNSGNIIWIKNIFDQVDPNAWNELPYHMFISKDTNCIITGSTIYNDYGGEIGHDKPFIMAAGMDGSEKWWIIDGANDNRWGDDKRSIEDSYGNILTVGWGGNFSSIALCPTLLKTDKYGNSIYRKYVIDSTGYGNAFCINIINDTIYDIGGGWNYPGQPNHTVIARTDQNGNLILEKNINESAFLLKNSIKTFDNKELFTEPFSQGEYMRKIYLHKFNYDLEYDSAYTIPFDYDYMCGNLPIVSDTIGIDDCDLWTGLPGEIEYRMAKYLVIYPNPAEHEITIKLPYATADENPWGPMTSRQYNFRYHENSVLKVFNIYGKLLKYIPLKNVKDKEAKLDVSGFSTGIYLINLFENQKLMASGKFVKR